MRQFNKFVLHCSRGYAIISERETHTGHHASVTFTDDLEKATIFNHQTIRSRSQKVQNVIQRETEGEFTLKCVVTTYGIQLVDRHYVEDDGKEIPNIAL